MSVLAVRGGFPFIVRGTIDSVGRRIPLLSATCYLIIEAEVNPVKVYFSEADYTAGVRYWSGSEFHGPAEVEAIWVCGDGGDANVQVVAFHRRG